MVKRLGKGKIMHESWATKLHKLRETAKVPFYHVLHQRIAGKVIYPPSKEVFNAFNAEYDTVRVVIIGQDPYHGPNQANGLAFAVNDGCPLPPSLENIFKELVDDIGCSKPLRGNLLNWRDQGVLLLNTSLTVEAGKPGSHKDIGWKPFVEKIIQLLNEDKENLVFILWGKHAQEFQNVIDTGKHKIIKSAHPSPYSADYGFFGSKPFSKCNDYLIANNKQIINWN